MLAKVLFSKQTAGCTCGIPIHWPVVVGYTSRFSVRGGQDWDLGLWDIRLGPQCVAHKIGDSNACGVWTRGGVETVIQSRIATSALCTTSKHKVLGL